MPHQRRRPLRLAVLPIAFALVIAACGGDGGGGGESGTSNAIKEGGTLSYAADQEPTGFNNNTSKDNGTSVLNVVINMFPPVFRLHPDFSVQLNKELMDSAEQTSTDPQTIVYKIKENAVWSDGTPVSADDFEYLWKNLNGSIKDNDVAATTGYDQIESVEGSDNGKTVTVVFSEPFSDWKSLFYGLLPAQYMAKVAGGWNTGLDKAPEKIPTNGPYVVSGWEQGQSLTLARNDKYFGPKPHLDSIVFRFLPESTTQPAALQNNEVDLIYPQPQLDLVAQVKALPDVTSELNIGLSFEHLDFNFKNEHLADANVRKAIATGLNIGELVDRTVRQFTDEAQPLGNRIWLPGQPYYQDHFAQYGKADVAGAAKLLEDAGYTKGADGIYAKGGKPLSLRISTTAGNQLRETQEQLIQAQLKQVGIDIKIVNADNRKFFGEWLPQGNFDIANFGWVGNPFAISSNQDIYRTGGGSNYGQYASDKVDQLFRQAVREVDEAKSAELGNQIDQQLTADMATIPLYAKPTYLAVRNTFANVGDNATQEGPFWNSGLWAQKAA
ncbi:MAG TPA: ABC transporter family substrate-binding protein [Actinomycetota bacterium]|nr:ABC transporter family substrate-binding protein [Actinomycetota bacterium]